MHFHEYLKDAIEKDVFDKELVNDALDQIIDDKDDDGSQ